MLKLPGIPYDRLLPGLPVEFAGTASGGKKPRPKVKSWSRTLRRLWSYLCVYKLRLFMVGLLVCASSILGLLGPVVIGAAVDLFLSKGNVNGLLKFLAGLALIYFAHTGAVMLQSYLMIGTAQQTVAALRRDLFSKLHRLPLSYFAHRKHGEVMSRLTNDIEHISQTLNSSFIQLCSSFITFTGMIVFMLWLSPLLTLITMLIIPAMMMGMRWITARTGVLFKHQQQYTGSLTGFLEETMSGQRIVKMFSREKQMIRFFQHHNGQLMAASFWAQTYSGFVSKLMIMLNNMSFAIIAAAGGVLAVYQLVTIGVIVTFTEYARQFARPLNDLAVQLNTLLSAVAGAERVFEVLDEEEEKDQPQAVQLTQARGDVCFHHVHFSYGGQNAVLTNLCFRAAPGETVAIIGPTGAGKSTIAQLLARFYDIQEGEGAIYVDGCDIRTLTRDSLRNQLGFVLQDVFLFDLSIRDNIRYSKPTASDEEVECAAKLANAHEFIEMLPNGYETILQENGSSISHGQKQLLSIARAILADPAVLVLDEATSSIDTLTEMLIQESLQRLMRGRTNIVIAHRLNTIRKADRILVLDQGQIVEEGTHEILLEQKGFYYSMHKSSAS